MAGVSPMGNVFAADRIAGGGAWYALYLAVREMKPDLTTREFDDAWERLFTDLSRTSGRLERYLFLDGDRLATLGSEGSIGRHWTTDGSVMQLDALYVPDEADDSWCVYLVTGTVDDPDMIDWPQTLKMRIDLPWENEVVLRDDAEVRIGSVHLYDETERRPVTRVRRDLEGTVLRASVARSTPVPS